MYTFRVLRDDELDNKQHIAAKGQFGGAKSLKKLLSTVNSHVIKGRREDSPWISISSDFLRDVERYNMPLRGHNETRNRMAILTGLDKTIILPKKGYNPTYPLLDMPVYGFDKIVLDYSTADSVNEIKKNGLAVNVKGEVTRNYSRTHAYSQHDKELLVFDKIPAKNIEMILTPLDIDILYAIIASGICESQDEAVGWYLYSLLPMVHSDPEMFGLTEIEALLFRQFYGENKHLVTVATEILRENSVNYILVKKSDWNIVDVLDLTKDGIIYNYDEGIDVLNVFAYLKRKKRVILEKILASLGVEMRQIKLPEDVMQMVRIGNVRQNGVLRVFYKGGQLFIPPQSYASEKGGVYSNLNDVSVAVMHGNTELCDNNMYWLNEADEITTKVHEYQPDTYLRTVCGKNGVKILMLQDFKQGT